MRQTKQTTKQTTKLTVKFTMRPAQARNTGGGASGVDALEQGMVHRA
jgi:hypothetical protein